MILTIEIVDRNYEQIKEFCDFNQIKIEDYIVQCVEDDYFTRKYGDLNEKLNPSKPKIEEKPLTKEIDKSIENKTEEEKKVEKKKVGRPRKKKVEEEPTLKEEKKEEPIIEEKQIEKEEQPKKIKRTLKTR